MELLKNRLVVLSFLLAMVIYLGPLHSAIAIEKVDGEPVLQFPVFSDLHIGGEVQKERFIDALNDYQTVAPNYQAMVMVGDLTNYGAEMEYDDFNKILNSYINPYAEKVIAIGNHEYMEGIYSTRGLDEELYRKRFVDKTGMPGGESQVYYDKWIEDYHFITLGSEGYLTPNDYASAKLSEEQYSWLEKKLAENADPKKPIFVFLHQGIDDTVYGTERWGAGFNDSRLSEILKQYPQVILFSGHSHYLLNHPRTIYQDGFTMVNTGSVAYGFTDLGATTDSQGLLVNVYADRVEIKARDFTSKTWVQTFTVKTPYEKTYGEQQKPYFNYGSIVKVENNSKGDKVTLSLNAAVDNTLVDKYVVKHNGRVIHTVYTKFWENNVLDRVYADVQNLSPETQYNLVITAVDAWNNESLNTVKVSFKTPKLNGWKMADDKWLFYENGVKVTGWKFIDRQWYLFLNDGVMYTGWYSSGIHTYYLNVSGNMQVGWKEINGRDYYFGTDGAMKTGWVLDYSNRWYYLNKDGSAKYGWVLDLGDWYFVKPEGMVTGWQKIGNSTWYFFNSSGTMETGWILSNGKWYYLDNSGAMKVGWIMSGNRWYYLESSGAMETGWLFENRKWYYLQNDGVMQTGMATINHVNYYFAPDGSMQ